MENTINEEWKSCAIVGCPRYEVSNLGNVRAKGSEKNLKSNKHKNGYHMICLYDQHKERRVFNIGRLVLCCFKPVAEMAELRALDCDHIDSNKANNRLENLQWLTHKENIQRIKHKKGCGKGNKNTKGFFLVYEDSIEYYRNFKICPIHDQTLYTMLKDHHYSKKFQCKAYYFSELPDEYQHMIDISDSII